MICLAAVSATSVGLVLAQEEGGTKIEVQKALKKASVSERLKTEIPALAYDDETLSDVLKDLQKKAKVKFVMDEAMIEHAANNSVTLNVMKVLVVIVLALLGEEYAFEYRVDEDNDAVKISLKEERESLAERLRGKTSVAYDDMPLTQVLSQMSLHLKTSAIMDEVTREKIAKTPVTLHMTDVEWRKVMDWLKELYDIEYELDEKNNAIIIKLR